jgi:hypothetical protein
MSAFADSVGPVCQALGSSNPRPRDKLDTITIGSVGTTLNGPYISDMWVQLRWEAIVGDWTVVGNLERGRPGERDMRVRDVGGVTRCFASTSMSRFARKFKNPSLPSSD